MDSYHHALIQQDKSSGLVSVILARISNRGTIERIRPSAAVLYANAPLINFSSPGLAEERFVKDLIHEICLSPIADSRLESSSGR